eukprot:384020_1
MTGVRLHKMNEKEIEVILMNKVSFYMEYNCNTKEIYNVKFTKHISPKYRDEFSKCLVDMVGEIGNKINVMETLKTLSDLKEVIYDVLELISGISDLRACINLCKNVIDIQREYKLVIKPLDNKKLDECNVKIALMKDVEYNNVRNNNQMMKTQLLVQSVFNIRLGYPFNRMRPEIKTTLNRQIYKDDINKFKSVSNINERSGQMEIQKKINKILENKLGDIKLGRHLLIRCVNLIYTQMEKVLVNESNCKHSADIYG